MDANLLKILIGDVLVPEISLIFRARQQAGVPPPTSEEVIALLQSDVDRYVATGQAFLDRTK